MKKKNWRKLVKQILTILTALVVLVLVLAFMSGAFSKKVQPGSVDAEERKLAGQPTDEVHQVIQTEQVRVVGTIRAERLTEISARIMAKIEELTVRAGDRVEKGDLLVRLDDRDLQARVEEARQAVNAAESNLQNAERDYNRFKKMLEDKAVSEREFDTVRTRYETAQAQLKQASESLKAAEAVLSYAEIRSPVSGVVVDKLMDVGDNTQPSRPLLAIYDPANLRLEAAVPENMAQGFKVGDELQMTIDTIEKTQQRPVSGVIEEIVPQADVGSRSILFKVRIPHGLSVVEGTFARLLIPSKDRVRLCVAQSAVREVGQLRFVDVVRPDKTLERRQVKLGERSPFGRVEALSGLEAGETVVLYGPPPEPLPENARLFRGGAAQ